ncbi:MAG: class I SAM-dependent methyltransferase [Candidatus Sulfotelmatobacter sp.]
MSSPEFDLHADNYDAELNEALSVSGEDKQYFASRRVQWLARCVAKLGEIPSHILDYGCGIGDTSCLLQTAFAAESVVGVDISPRSIELAARRNGTTACQFKSFSEYTCLESIDLAYCNGVFHHIPVNMRSSAVEYIYTRLRPGGIFSFWENNPWNPGTRYVMAQCVFDHDAITIPPPQAKVLLRQQGFEIVRTDYCFFFPRFLGALRFLETRLARFPFGAQYQILCRRPSHLRSR